MKKIPPPAQKADVSSPASFTVLSSSGVPIVSIRAEWQAEVCRHNFYQVNRNRSIREMSLSKPWRVTHTKFWWFLIFFMMEWTRMTMENTYRLSAICWPQKKNTARQMKKRVNIMFYLYGHNDFAGEVLHAVDMMETIGSSMDIDILHLFLLDWL